VDSYLYLVGPNGQVIASDDDGGGRPNSRIPAGTGTLTLPASGTYTIEATTFSASEQGAFTLTLTTGGAGTALSLAPDTVRLTAVRGGASAPVSVEVRGAASEPRVSPQQSWLRAAASGSAGGVYRYAVSADASALTPGNYSGRVLFAVEDRTLTLTASLIVSAPSGSECETQPITLGSSVSGSLTASSCRSARQANSYASRYSFAARAGEGVRIQLGAPNMDPYLYLFDAAGTLIAADDDSGGGNDARIPSTGNFLTLAAAGTYFIEATTFGSNETGTFSLRLESAASAARGRPAFQLAGVTNAASFGTNYGRPGTTVGGIAPGQMVTIFGSDLGPDSIAYGSFQGDRLATSVSGTRVLIGGVPAPVIYAARNQVAAIVPYAVAQLSRTSIVVEASAQASEPISVPVIRAAPGIFASGGNCACTNPRGAVSAGNPTSRGEVVTIFATGEGQTSPFGVDGLAVTREPLPRPLLPVSVLIGGVNAPVLYAGHAPGLPGLLQVNAVVPAAASPGAVPIQIVITDPVSGLLYFSQSGLNTLVR
jgi:uncharacterized protein (TIGR03437 family)